MEHGVEAEHFWENHYSGREQVWRGTPNALLVETVAGEPPGRALDLGCGEGGDAVWLATRGWQVTAVDISATALSRTAARAAGAGAGAGDRVTTERHDLARTFPGGTFDLVNAQYLHTPFDLPRARVLREAAHALNPGGLLLVVDHGSVLPWAWNPDADAHFPAPQDIFAELDLDPAHWRPERLDRPNRQATGPAGETATATDTVVAVRRLTGSVPA
ncbi:class I SAM-dependent methyltransferase [Sphaerisporangium aureirubrum]|uniref:Class I SAM-dependent methyltransferase n=1 Tax=Sphaerisporangium aureirubrum TaxID=1544736 RepID=A0ABW1NCL1_9ACTN